MTKTLEEWAEELNRVDYSDLNSYEDDLADDGMVVVYGASDDLMEVIGAHSEEYGAMSRTKYTWIKDDFYSENALEEVEDVLNDCCEPFIDVLNEYMKTNGKNYIIVDPDVCDYQFAYETNIPHKKFDVIDEDGDVYCQALIFDVKSLKQ